MASNHLESEKKQNCPVAEDHEHSQSSSPWASLVCPKTWAQALGSLSFTLHSVEKFKSSLEEAFSKLELPKQKAVTDVYHAATGLIKEVEHSLQDPKNVDAKQRQDVVQKITEYQAARQKLASSNPEEERELEKLFSQFDRQLTTLAENIEKCRDHSCKVRDRARTKLAKDDNQKVGEAADRHEKTLTEVDARVVQLSKRFQALQNNGSNCDELRQLARELNELSGQLSQGGRQYFLLVQGVVEASPESSAAWWTELAGEWAELNQSLQLHSQESVRLVESVEHFLDNSQKLRYAEVPQELAGAINYNWPPPPANNCSDSVYFSDPHKANAFQVSSLISPKSCEENPVPKFLHQGHEFNPLGKKILPGPFDCEAELREGAKEAEEVVAKLERLNPGAEIPTDLEGRVAKHYELDAGVAEYLRKRITS